MGMATEAQRRKDEMEQSASDYATKTQNIADAAENKYNNAQQAADDAMATAQRLAAEAARAKTQFQHRDSEAKVAAHSRDKLINLNIFHFWPEARQGGQLESSATKAGEAPTHAKYWASAGVKHRLQHGRIRPSLTLPKGAACSWSPGHYAGCECGLLCVFIGAVVGSWVVSVLCISGWSERTREHVSPVVGTFEMKYIYS